MLGPEEEQERAACYGRPFSGVDEVVRLCGDSFSSACEYANFSHQVCSRIVLVRHLLGIAQNAHVTAFQVEFRVDAGTLFSKYGVRAIVATAAFSAPAIFSMGYKGDMGSYTSRLYRLHHILRF